MAKKKTGSNTGIPGVSFSWKRALGVSKLKSEIARDTGIPTTKGGRRQKFARAVGCLVVLLAPLALVGCLAVWAVVK